MKKSRIIAPALGVLILSTAASITGTVAWFTANNSVQVTGMSVKTKVGNNIMIAADTLNSSAKIADNLFAAENLTQTVRGILEPVSTVDGKDFYYTTNAKGNGDAVDNVTYVKYGTEAALTGTDASTWADAFSKAYNVSIEDAEGLFPAIQDPAVAAEQGAKPYVDYVFQLKVVNAENSDKKLNLTTLTLTYTQDASETMDTTAFRVAMLVQDITSTTPTGFTSTATGIFAPSSAANFSDADSKNFAISGTAAANVSQLSVAGNKYNNTNLGELATVSANDTAYYKIITRLYIEGEDTTCTNDTFAALTGSWALDLKLELGGTKVTALTLA